VRTYTITPEELGVGRAGLDAIRGGARERQLLRREAQIGAREEAVRVRAQVEEEIAGRRAETMKVEERIVAQEPMPRPGPAVVGNAVEVDSLRLCVRVRQGEHVADQRT